MTSTSASGGRSGVLLSNPEAPSEPLSISNLQQRRTNAEVQRSLARLPIVDLYEKSVIFCCFANESVFRILITTYWVWILVSFLDNVNVIFPGLYLFPICSMLAALMGSATGIYQLVVPFMLMTVFDSFCSSVDLFCLISLHSGNKTEPLLNYLDEKWPAKMQQYVRWDVQNFKGYAAATIARILFALAAAMTAGQEITRFRTMNYVERRRNEIYRHQSWRHNRNMRTFVSEAFNNNRVGPNDGAIVSNMLFTPSPASFYTTTNIPPPPAYQTLPSLRTPTSGTPPPSYSTIERQQAPLPTNSESMSAPVALRFDEASIPVMLIFTRSKCDNQA